MIHVGTSGWQYRDWRGPFYPEKLPQRSWLQHYATRFPVVEVNNSFYMLPKEETFDRWRQSTPHGFSFVVKASRYITHIRRLRDPKDPVDLFWSRARRLGPKLGPVLFQLPPNFPADEPLLEDFLHVLPKQVQAAVEFRDSSWETDRVYAILDRAGAALVLPDRPSARIDPVVTGGWSYVRFHKGRAMHPGYTRGKLRRWADRIAAMDARDVWCFFNNDTWAAAPADADTLMELLADRGLNVARSPAAQPLALTAGLGECPAMPGMRVNRPGEPAYAGVGATFSKLPLVLDPRDLRGADVVIVGAPIDEPVTYRPGARFGPRAIRLADVGGGAHRPNMDVRVDPFEVLAVVDYGDAEVVPADQARSHLAIRRAVSEIREAGAIPIVLGGDHSIAHPDVGAVAGSVKPEALGLVHFDAHADNVKDLYGVTLSHGTPMRRLVDEGSLEGSNIVQVGLRGYWPDREDFEWARGQGFRWHLMEEITERGMDAVMADVVTAASRWDHMFLSFDIDVCDPAFAPGTGTPEPGGITAREALRAVRRLAWEVGFAGMEVVEVSPPYDHGEITAFLANRIVLEALSGLALRKLGQEPNPERSP